MRFSLTTALLLTAALNSLAVPLYDLDEDLSLAARSEEFEDLYTRTPPDDWSTVHRDNKFKQTGRLQPHPGHQDTHITYKQGGDKKRNPPVHTDQYQVWKQNPHKPGHMTDGGRWRGNDDVGKSHGGIKPPIWHPAAGEVKGKKAYQATDRQNPPSYNHAKFSKSIKDKVNNMPSKGHPTGKSKDDMQHKSKKQGHMISRKGSKEW